MPIKVRCRACETVLNVPDKAAGRVVLCKSCGGKVKIPVPTARQAPAEDASAASATKAPARRKRRPPENDDAFGGSFAGSDFGGSETSGGTGDFEENLFGGINLNRAEDNKRKVCPSCATPVHVNDEECPKCGVNIATGTLSERQRTMRARKGPPPDEFYKKVWSDGGKFLKKHMNYAVLTAVIWSTTLSMAVTCAYAHSWYVRTRAAELLESAGTESQAQIVGDKLIITIPKDGKAKYDNKLYTTGETERIVTLPAPHIAPYTEPPALFWAGMTIVFQLGFGGWAWTLATNIAELTMAGQKKIKRFNPDFFGNLTMGFRFYFWPTVVMLPVLWTGIALSATGNVVIGGIITAIIALIPMLLFLPAAVVHMTQKYSYRAWLINWMAMDFLKTIGPSLFIAALNVVLVLLLPCIIAGVIFATQGTLFPRVMEMQASVLEWLSTNVFDLGEGSMRFLLFEMPLVFSAMFIIYGVLCALISFPAVFMMRVIGLYGVYFKPDLSLVNEFADDTPAGFGPRFLAFLVDLLIMLVLLIPASVIGWLGGIMFVYYGYSELGEKLSAVVYGLSALALWGIYFAKGESGQARATLGKWSIGLIVLAEDDKPLTPKKAFGRVGAAFVTVLTAFIGFVLCAFRSDHRSMHDMMSKSKVIWRSEDST